MKIAFEALIKQLTVKSLVSGDKEGRLLLEFLPKNETLNILNQLHSADKMVYVVVMDKESFKKKR